MLDFCLWGSPVPSGEIGNIEASVVAYVRLLADPMGSPLMDVQVLYQTWSRNSCDAGWHSQECPIYEDICLRSSLGKVRPARHWVNIERYRSLSLRLDTEWFLSNGVLIRASWTRTELIL